MRLFVYGTLRLGHPNGERFGLTSDRLVKQGAKLADHALYPVSWFPGIKPCDLSSFVIGDIFEVPDELWGSLDAYEGVPSLYTRSTVTIDGHETEVYVYNGHVNPDNRITTGEWKSHG